jgi:hypothetical protein
MIAVPSSRNRNVKQLLLAFALVSGFTLSPVATRAAEPAKLTQGDPVENKAVRVVAMQFLAEIDGGHVGNTWALASDYLRGVLTRAEWEKGIVDARAGRAPVDRDLLGALFTPGLDGDRKGHFFIVVYKTRYGSQWYQERVILALQGKQWKVDGYWILPSDEKGAELKQG